MGMKRLGIVAHSAEGGALCFITACREGQALLGPHMHPEIMVSAIPMGLSLHGWESGEYGVVAEALLQGIEQVAKAGADFFICPDNTAHIVLEQVADTFPIPGLHIADVVALEMQRQGWKVAGLLGTRWTMTGPVYPAALGPRGLEQRTPDAQTRAAINSAIFDELCQGVFLPATTRLFQNAIDDLAGEGADCVILGCTEIPIIINEENASLPVLDSTRLLARYAVQEALSEEPLSQSHGWLRRDSSA